jgi:tRNA-dihydrouridine synthase
MVGASDYAFRTLVRRYCPEEPILGYTQMLHAKKLLQDKTFRRNHLDFCDDWKEEDQPQFLSQSQLTCIEGMEDMGILRRNPPDEDEEEGRHRHQEGGPLMVQLAGHCPSIVVDAAQLVVDHAPRTVSGIDLNLGCPQGIARKGRYGAFLMEQDEDLVCNILSQLRLSLPTHVKVSAKIRLPLDGDDLVLKSRIAKLVDTGIDFLTIHGRTLKENKVTVGPCHFDTLRLAIDTARAIRPDFPVIANGGIENHESIASVLRDTGACAVMSSEALLETPNLFTVPSIHENPRAVLNQQLMFARDYIALCAVHPPVAGSYSPDGGSFNVARGHLFKFLHRYIQMHDDLRLRMTDTMPWNLKSAALLIDELECRYQSDADFDRFCGPSWYLRHRAGRDLIHHRGPTKDEPPELTVDERKRQMLTRIQHLRELKEEKEQRLVR